MLYAPAACGPSSPSPPPSPPTFLPARIPPSDRRARDNQQQPQYVIGDTKVEKSSENTRVKGFHPNTLRLPRSRAISTLWPAGPHDCIAVVRPSGVQQECVRLGKLTFHLSFRVSLTSSGTDAKSLPHLDESENNPWPCHSTETKNDGKRREHNENIKKERRGKRYQIRGRSYTL